MPAPGAAEDEGACREHESEGFQQVAEQDHGKEDHPQRPRPKSSEEQPDREPREQLVGDLRHRSRVAQRLGVKGDDPQDQPADDKPETKRKHGQRMGYLRHKRPKEDGSAEHGEYPSEHGRKIRRPHAHRVSHRVVLGYKHEGEPERDEHQPGPEILAVRYLHFHPSTTPAAYFATGSTAGMLPV